MPVSKAKVRKLALALEGASEVVHVDRPAFRTSRKIFATLPPSEAAVNLMFDPPTQEFFCEQARGVIVPLPGGWGRMGMARCDLGLRGRIAGAFRAQGGACAGAAEAQSQAHAPHEAEGLALSARARVR